METKRIDSRRRCSRRRSHRPEMVDEHVLYTVHRRPSHPKRIAQHSTVRHHWSVVCRGLVDRASFCRVHPRHPRSTLRPTATQLPDGRVRLPDPGSPRRVQDEAADMVQLQAPDGRTQSARRRNVLRTTTRLTSWWVNVLSINRLCVEYWVSSIGLIHP